jgi:hypothetical protein
VKAKQHHEGQHHDDRGALEHLLHNRCKERCCDLRWNYKSISLGLSAMVSVVRPAPTAAEVVMEF